VRTHGYQSIDRCRDLCLRAVRLSCSRKEPYGVQIDVKRTPKSALLVKVAQKLAGLDSFVHISATKVIA
ncbi:hypothetical protein, partial [Pseudalkalibacillus decolorationis]|uniref:hypothetical protein n=1 Tax=Pseudalkalibacillus decolorationis TaxID=163879 RepID=UPI0021489835